MNITSFAVTESASGLSSLGNNLKGLAFQIIAFAIVLWILNKYAIRRILVILDQRKEELQKGLDEAAQATKTLEQATSKADKILAEARTEADEILSGAHGEASQLLKTIEDKANLRAENIITEARNQLSRDVEKARAELVSETSKLVVKVASVFIGDKLTYEKDMMEIEKQIKESAK